MDTPPLYRPHPDVYHGMPVTMDAFHALPRPPSWKYELWDGALQLEPDWRFASAVLAAPPEVPAPPAGLTVRAATADDAEALLDLLDAAFAHTPDFFRVEAPRRRIRLRRDVEAALCNEPRAVARASTLALDADGVPVSAVLVREVAGGVTLSLVGTHPGARRRGLARALLATAARALPEGAQVRSGWLVANRESGLWHRAAGFLTIPTSLSLRSHLSALRWAARQGAAPHPSLDAFDAHLRDLDQAERAGFAIDPYRFASPLHRGQDDG